jgi:hypothetical protein
MRLEHALCMKLFPFGAVLSLASPTIVLVVLCCCCCCCRRKVNLLVSEAVHTRHLLDINSILNYQDIRNALRHHGLGSSSKYSSLNHVGDVMNGSQSL